jgi:methyltransferase (TIGR00027 family)
MMVAAYRARATAAGSPLCRDPWAAALAGEEGHALADSLDRLQTEMETWIAVRTAFIDRHVRDLTGPRCRFRQVVVLGAGLDTRAARLDVDASFYEVDHPATSAEKQARMARLDGYPSDAATYVPCDFERDDFLDRLVAAGFDREAPAAVVWEGVTPYLTETAVRATLRRIAEGCEPRTSVVFDTVGRKMAEGSSSHHADRDTGAMVDAVGEPIRWGTDYPLPLLFEEGFRKVRVVSFDEAALELTGTYDRARKWRFQSIVTASVAAPEIDR